MILTDDVKRAIDALQTRIVPCYKSDNVLLIFDSKYDLEEYKRKHKYMTPDQILITISNLKNTAGLKFKRFHFVTEEELQEKID